MIKAVIFDMDGLIIDSEPIQSLAFKEILAEYGIGPINEGIVQIPGIRSRENWELLKQRYGLEEDVTVLVQKRTQAYIRLLKDYLQPRPGLLPLIQALKAKGYRLALATSSTSSVDLVVEGLGLRSAFDVIVSGHDVERPKPDPEIFLLAARKLGVSPLESLALEDSTAGVEAAKKAGMRCIAIPNESTQGQDFSQADLVVESLTQIKPELVEALPNI